ncbi:hypothetical protein V8C34DRAFT_282614 [Trichoderma compactum]
MASAPSSVPAGMENFTVGLIGMGDMGRMYADRLSEAGWRILACDREDRYDSLKEKYNGKVRTALPRSTMMFSFLHLLLFFLPS